MVKDIIVRESITLRVCPWQYTECNKPASEKCPIEKRKLNELELDAWIREVEKARLCKHAGQKLNTEQYEYRHIGIFI